MRIKGLAARRRAVEKRDLSRSSSRKLRGFRGKKSTKTLDDDVGVVGRYASKVFARGTKMNKKDSAEFRIQKARRARLKSGREFKPKKNTQMTLEARYDLCELVARFKRTGKLPNRAVRIPDLEASDQTHVNKYHLREMIEAMLIRSGIKPNPGPEPKKDPEPHPPMSISEAIENVRVMGGVYASQLAGTVCRVSEAGKRFSLGMVARTLKFLVPKMQRLKSVVELELLRSGNVERNPGPRNKKGAVAPQKWVPKFPGAIRDSAPTSSSSEARVQRDQEKIDNCAGNMPGDKERLDGKRRKGHKNFKKESLIHLAEMVDDDERGAIEDVQREKEKERDEEEEEIALDAYNTERPGIS